MFAYVMRKLLLMPFILLGVVAFTFVLFTISTRPEALATIQLGEKTSPRQKYQWLERKGYISWTERGREKLAKMESGELPTRTMQLFNVDMLEELASERDRLAEKKEALDADDESNKVELAELADKIFKNKGQIQSLLNSARVTYVIETIGIKGYEAMQYLASKAAALEEAGAALEAARKSKDGEADAEKAVADATAAHAQAVKNAGDYPARLKAVTAEAQAKLKEVEDISADLAYTSRVTMFVHYLGDLARFEFGDTRTGRPVSEVLYQGMGPSLSLALPAFLLAELIALFFGLLAAMYRKTKLDYTLVISSIVLMSLNAIAIIIAGQKFMASDWNYFPVAGYGGGFAAIRFLMLPSLLYVVLSFGEHVRFNRIVMLDEVGQDYVRTARAKGLNENAVLFKHVLRNSLIPLITRWTVAIPTLYTGSLVLESFFGIPGLGYITVDAISNSDGNVIRAIVVIGAVSFMLANLLADVLYAVVDPRVRLE